MPERLDDKDPLKFSEKEMGNKAKTQLVILSGISGGGKTTALKAFEDIGFDAVDNPPFSALLPILEQPGADKLVVGVDARTRGLDVDELLAARDRLAREGERPVNLVYLDCEEETALRRFKETRRRHPLSADGSPREGLAMERRLLARLKAEADAMLDTSLLSPRELKRWIAGTFGPERSASLSVQIISFSYRVGLPREADLVFDVRFLSNPHYHQTLRPKSGLDPEVAAFVEADPGTARLLKELQNFLGFVLPRYEQEGKSYLTVAIGCTGGRHRSVYVAENVSTILSAQGWPVSTTHRDMGREHQFQAAR